MTAMQEFVVPKSIPNIFAIIKNPQNLAPLSAGVMPNGEARFHLAEDQ
jgi:hypothetical protein